MRRYATVRLHSLNGGIGEVIRNFDNAADFRLFWRGWCKGFDLPTHGVGSIGDGIFGISYKIYGGECRFPRTLI